MPEGVVSMSARRVSRSRLTLVTHPLIRARLLHGSLNAGRTLFDAAAMRPNRSRSTPRWVLEPVFVLPGALRRER
jgi:acyl-CoA reductase-like NAD-dependent aldehyde dehydrogenase